MSGRVLPLGMVRTCSFSAGCPVSAKPNELGSALGLSKTFASDPPCRGRSCRQSSIPVRAGAFCGILRYVHSSDCLSACCGLPRCCVGSLDGSRGERLVLVGFASCCGRRTRGYFCIPCGQRTAACGHESGIRRLRALRPASADCFLSFLQAFLSRYSPRTPLPPT